MAAGTLQSLEHTLKERPQPSATSPTMPVLPCSVGTSVIDTTVVDDLSLKSNFLTPELHGARANAGFERRVAWLEEDVAVLHRRLRDEYGDNSTGGNAAGDLGLRGLVARLDGELASERRSRELLEAKVHALDDRLLQESMERKAQLDSFSNELENTMRALISRIDDGLTASTAAMSEKTGQTEERLRLLLERVDEGLTAGAVALQDTLDQAVPKLDRFGEQGGYAAEPPQQEVDADAENLIQAWDELRQENQQLREQCLQRQEAARHQHQAVVYARPQVAVGNLVTLGPVAAPVVAPVGAVGRPLVVATPSAPGVPVYRAAQSVVRTDRTEQKPQDFPI